MVYVSVVLKKSTHNYNDITVWATIYVTASLCQWMAQKCYLVKGCEAAYDTICHSMFNSFKLLNVQCLRSIIKYVDIRPLTKLQ